jgi:hypothetical protein
MATLVVTFSSAFSNPARAHSVPLATGSMARTEIITLGSASGGGTPGTLLCAANEDVAELVADADCWVAIGDAPNPESTDDDGARLAHYLKADMPYQYRVAAGQSVAASEA